MFLWLSWLKESQGLCTRLGHLECRKNRLEAADHAAGDFLLLSEMIYKSSSREFCRYLMKGVSFVKLHTSGDSANPPASYIPARMLRRPRNISVPVFVVAQPGQAWSLGCFAATPEQCQKNRSHLCIVVCKNATEFDGKKKLCEASEILCFPTIETAHFDHLSKLATVVKSDIMLQRALRRLKASELPPEDLLVTMAPCILARPREDAESEEESEDSAGPCIVCFGHSRSWRWSKCEHRTDGPALVCHWCKKQLLQAQRDAEKIRDRRAFVLTRCIICNRTSKFKRVSAVKSKADSTSSESPVGFGLAAQPC